MTIVWAIILGFSFGFVLQKAGATNRQNIIGMLRLHNFHLAKAIMLAIGFSSLALFILVAPGWVDVSNFSVKSSYVGVIVGGVILGVGWAMGGYCPGTGVAAVGAGRVSAVFYVLGGLVGALVFTLAYAALQDSFLFTSLLGGKASLAVIAEKESVALLPQFSALLVAGSIGAVFILAAFLLPEPQYE